MKSALLFLLLSRMPVTEVTINGSGPYRFAIDTGAASSMITSRAARVAGLIPDSRVEIVTATGHRLVPATAKTTVAAGALTVPQVEMLWWDEALAGKVDGILGQNFLAGQSYEINGRDGRVAFGTDLPHKRTTWLPLEWIEGRMAIRAESPGGGTLRLVIDSGASHLLLWPKAAIPMEDAGVAVATTHAGDTTVRLARLPWLRVGSVRLSSLTTGVLPGAREEDGLLPTNLFRRIIVSGDRIGFER